MFGNNPFNKNWANSEQVQEKADDDTVRMMKANPSMMKKGGPGGLKGLNKNAQKDVKKAMKEKFVIPEEIPANERTAFHGAAAAAAKAGKSHFNFAGKKHPVTMKKDLANKIADQKEGYYKDMDTNKSEPAPKPDAKVAADFKKRRKMNKPSKAEGGGKEGDVEMNPKSETTSKAEQKESKIRTALRSVLERKDHYKSATPPETMKDKIKGQGAEDMMKAADAEIEKGPDAHLNEPEIDKKNFEKMTSNVPSKKMRNNDNPKGDTKIVPGGTQFKDPAAMKAEEKNDVTPFKVESYDKMSTLKAAYASMYETQTEEVKDAD
jgi:hypothetical protein